MPFQTVECERCGEKNIDVLVVDNLCFGCLLKEADKLKREEKQKKKPEVDKELEDMLL
jgi:ribosomal protein L37E